MQDKSTAAKNSAESSQQALPHNLPQHKSGLNIGVIGGGYVGGTVAKWYRDHGASVKVYDKFLESDPVEEVLSQDYIFIAVPTNFDGKSIDLSAMDDAMKNASRAKTARAVIIKSTVVPGTTDKYQEQYPHLKIIFNPEFLTESTAFQDFSYPDRQIIGYTDKSYDMTGDIESILPLAPFVRFVPAKVAEMAKYLKEAAAADKRIGRSHLTACHGGYRGYGGKCLPKDTRALISFAKVSGVDLELLRVVEEINKRLTGGVDR
ncbi:MAG: UDP-glucose/GDP-mannose dehydrogenase dimerization [Parcubacteria group bacterium GW2011_GWA2_51_12]|nr:MAG: UDP-glucose/GDP-mannose dehydrogenase dimerization [Parcubacteria group bacterium GW2011_GWA2_51_12]